MKEILTGQLKRSTAFSIDSVLLFAEKHSIFAFSLLQAGGFHEILCIELHERNGYKMENSLLRRIGSSLIISIVFTYFTMNGVKNEQSLAPKNSKVLFWTSVLLIYVAHFIVMFIFLHLREKILLESYTNNADFERKHFNIKKNQKKYLIFILYWLIHIPAFLAFYPGIFGYDGPIQIQQFFSKTITSHHPVTHTLLLGVCFKIGNLLFGDYNKGLAIYVMLQLTIMSIIFTYITIWIYKRNSSQILRIGTMLFFALNPIAILLNINTTKDTLFAGFFAVMYIKLIDLMEYGENEEILKITTKFCYQFILLAIGMCLFRNQGYYLLAFTSIFAIILFWKKCKKIPLLIIISTIIGYFLMGPLLTILGIPKGDSREMLSVPMQQIACVWNENNKNTSLLTDEEVKKIEQLIPEKNLKEYQPYTADYVKNGFKTDVLKADVKGYAKLYISIGMRYPRLYIQAFLDMASGCWDFDQYGTVRTLLYSNTFETSDINICGIQRSSKYQNYQDALSYVVGEIYAFPIIREIYSQALPIWILVIAIILSLFEKKKAMFGSAMLLLGQWGIMLLSPMILVRYSYPLMLCVPILFVLIVEKRNNRRHF